MKMFFREGDDLFYGNLMYIPVDGGKRLFFDDHGSPRKQLSLLNPTIIDIGMSRMTVEHEGTTYCFYTDADWISTVYSVARWARSDYKHPKIDLDDIYDMMDPSVYEDR